jgi:hypothetical protein
MDIKKEDLEAAGAALGAESASLDLDSKSWEKFNAERKAKRRTRPRRANERDFETEDGVNIQWQGQEVTADFTYKATGTLEPGERATFDYPGSGASFDIDNESVEIRAVTGSTGAIKITPDLKTFAEQEALKYAKDHFDEYQSQVFEDEANADEAAADAEADRRIDERRGGLILRPRAAGGPGSGWTTENAKEALRTDPGDPVDPFDIDHVMRGPEVDTSHVAPKTTKPKPKPHGRWGVREWNEPRPR